MWKSKKRIRREIATEAMQALLITNASLEGNNVKSPTKIAVLSIDFADELIKQLKDS